MIDRDRPDIRAGLVRRVTALLLLAPIGFGMGVLGDVALTAIDGFRAPLGEAVAAAISRGLGGISAGLIAVVGALGGLMLARRRSAVSSAATGAGLALVLPSWAYAVIFFLTAPNYNILGAVIGAVGLVIAVVVGLLAGLIVSTSDRRAARGTIVPARVEPA